jgi:quercetin 2,3-dioxygenase
MLLEAEAIIHLAEKRECFQTDTFRRLSFEDIFSQNPDNQIITKFSDTTLAAQSSCNLLAKEGSILVLLPLVGAVEIFSSQEKKLLNAGEIAYFYLKQNDSIFIQNPFETELINYVEIWLKPDTNDVFENVFQEFNLEKEPNQLIQLLGNTSKYEFFIGKYAGRQEGVLPVNEHEKVFAFVINGVFEVQNRLLESRTGLTLWNTSDIEFEALAVDNIILLVKV